MFGVGVVWVGKCCFWVRGADGWVMAIEDGMAESFGAYGGAMMAPAERDALGMEGVRCHMVGIGGCGMSGLARMLRSRGAVVTGSDVAGSETAGPLVAEGFAVTLGQTEASLPADAEVVVASAAVGADHPEVSSAAGRGLRVMTYAEALGDCMLGRTGVAVAGTHGKSTTSAMLGWALMEGGIDPTVIVGAACGQVSPASAVGGRAGGFRLGAGAIPRGPLAGRAGVLVAEACEFNRSFHALHPTVAAITGVEADHLDVYGSLEGVIEAFGVFARRLPGVADGGRLLIGHDGAHRREVCAGVSCGVETIGFNPASDHAVSIEDGGAGAQLVVVRRGGEVELSFGLKMPGQHMAMNAATAGVLALWLGAERSAVEGALGGFRGVERRMELLGEVEATPTGLRSQRTTPPDREVGVRVWDDYGHHPTEVDATLRALREHEFGDGSREGRLICVFQPHQHSRTRFLLEEFAASFSQADVVIVPDIYFVRDSEMERTLVSAADLVDRLRERGVSAMHVYPFGAIVEQLLETCRDGDVVVTMGAGPVWKVARGLCAGGGDS